MAYGSVRTLKSESKGRKTNEEKWECGRRKYGKAGAFYRRQRRERRGKEKLKR
jgi:hypothetical protein